MYGWKGALDAARISGELLATEKGWDSDQEARAVAEYSGKIRGFLDELELGED
jgi:hypothetical protein